MVVFQGIYPALVTPTDAHGEVNLPVLTRIVEYHLSKNVDGFYIGGTTGEGIYMTVADRQKMTERVLEVVNGQVPIIAHVGAVSLADAQTLARHAAEHGANGFASIMPPLYNSVASVVSYYKALAASVPDLPFFSYILNPQLDPVAVVSQLLQVPNLVGAKYTGPNMFEMRNVMDLGGENWITFSGMDEESAYAAMMGVQGCIGSTLNFMPNVYREIRDAVNAGDHAKAQDLQVRANKITYAMIQVGFSGALVSVLNHLGFECGAPRLPNLALSEEAKTKLFASLRETDFEEFVAL